jgi:hypothetical protein
LDIKNKTRRFRDGDIEHYIQYTDGEFEYDFTWLAKSVDRILEITESVEKAKTAGILVVSSSLEETF